MKDKNILIIGDYKSSLLIFIIEKEVFTSLKNDIKIQNYKYNNINLYEIAYINSENNLIILELLINLFKEIKYINGIIYSFVNPRLDNQTTWLINFYSKLLSKVFEKGNIITIEHLNPSSFNKLNKKNEIDNFISKRYIKK